MKVRANKNYTVKIVPEEMEYGSGSDSPFAGIYRVILNNTITMFFVPSGDYTFSSSSFRLSVNSPEEIKSKKDAALLTMMNGSYSVTSTIDAVIPASGYYYLEQKQQEETTSNLIFIINNFTLNSILLELDHFVEKQNEAYPQSVLHYEEIKNSLLVKLIEEKIIPNKHFGAYEKEILGR